MSSYLLESPRWLLSRDSNSIEARISIKKLRGLRSERDVEYEIDNYLSANIVHKTRRNSAHSLGSLWDLLANPMIRVPVVSAIVLQMVLLFLQVLTN